jgi:hypothetical protein
MVVVKMVDIHYAYWGFRQTGQRKAALLVLVTNCHLRHGRAIRKRPRISGYQGDLELGLVGKDSDHQPRAVQHGKLADLVLVS